jgi:hypothetical protein
MNIEIIYDSSVQNAPAGFKVAVEAAVAYFDHLIINPISVPIVFSYGEIQGQAISSNALAQSSTNGNIETYASLVNLLSQAATSSADYAALAALAASDPSQGGRYWVSDALAKVFGLGWEPGYTDPEDGFVGLSSSVNFTYDPNNRWVAGTYDAVGAIEHEISEVLGRISYLGDSRFNGFRLYAPLDIFRYSAAGVHTVAYSGGYFSVDGQHLLYPFNDPNNGADGGDWAASVQADSFGYGHQGVAGLVSAVDIQVMDVLGFQIAAQPGVNSPNDFNHDGKSDVFWRNDSGELYVWNSQAGQGAFQGQTLGAVGLDWHVAATADFNGDGRADVLWRNNSGEAYVSLTVGDGATEHLAGQSLGGVDSSWAIQTAADFNGDGRADVLWRNASGEVYLWASHGSGDTIAFTGQSLGTTPNDWHIQGAADFNGDGRADILWRNDSGEVYVQDSAHTGAVALTGQSLGVVDNGWTIQGLGDFNGDGRADILWRYTSGELYVWNSAASGPVAMTGQSLGFIDLSWSVAAVGDYDGDGRADVLWRNAGGDVYVWNSQDTGAVNFAGQGLGHVSLDWHILSDQHLM